MEGQAIGIIVGLIIGFIFILVLYFLLRLERIGYEKDKEQMIINISKMLNNNGGKNARVKEKHNGNSE